MAVNIEVAIIGMRYGAILEAMSSKNELDSTDSL